MMSRLSVAELVDRFGFIPHVADSPDRVDGVLPGGYDAYTCVLHALTAWSVKRTLYRELTDMSWGQISAVQDVGRRTPKGLAGTEGHLDRESALILIDVLQIHGPARYVATYFFNPDEPVFNLSGDGLAQHLLSGEPPLGPLLWFPEDLSWVASTPYDDWQTYLASSLDLATKVRERTEIETLICAAT